MFTEEDFAGPDEELDVRAIFAAARGFKFSEETLRLHKLMDTDPKAAALVVRENQRKRYEKNIAPQRDAMLRQLQERQRELDAAAAAAAEREESRCAGDDDDDGRDEQVKRQRVVGPPPDPNVVVPKNK